MPRPTIVSALVLALVSCAAAGLAATPPKPLRTNFLLTQTDYEVGTPVEGQIVHENLSPAWVPVADAADMTKHLRLIVDGKELAPKDPEQFGGAKTKEIGPGGLVGVTFDLARLFPQLGKPGAYAVAYRAPGSVLEPLRFRMLPAFDPAQQHRLQLETPDGPLSIELYARAAPASVRNVVNLAHTGFYDGAEIVRIEPGVMIGIRGPVTPRHRIIPFEKTATELLAGTVLLEASGEGDRAASYPNLVVLLAPAPAQQGRYTAIGQVVTGQETLRKLALRPTSGKDGAPAFKPTTALTVSKATATTTAP